MGNGFAFSSMNAVFVDRRSAPLRVAGRETYHSDGGHFLYWCARESRWKGTASSDLVRVKAGHPVGFIGAPVRGDLFSPSLLVGWHEWEGGRWVPKQNAGVSAMGTT